jgi:DnaA family protein
MTAPMKQLVLDMALPTAPSLGNFFAGPNLDALSHLTLWLGEPGSKTRSPLSTYLWGDSGSGKSHLLLATRAALAARGEMVGWLDAGVQIEEPFDEHWTCVLMDDVHCYTLAQQHTAFNWFVNAQSQQIAVLAAGSLPPADLKLRDDLRSRLGWGHVFGLKPLDEAERRTVLRQAAQARGLALSNEVMDFMLHRFSRDLASLMELLTLLDGYALQTQRAITIPLIKSMMDNA